MPTILIGMLCGIAFLGLLRIAGPGIGEIFQQLQQITAGYPIISLRFLATALKTNRSRPWEMGGFLGNGNAKTSSLDRTLQGTGLKTLPAVGYGLMICPG